MRAADQGRGVRVRRRRFRARRLVLRRWRRATFYTQSARSGYQHTQTKL